MITCVYQNKFKCFCSLTSRVSSSLALLKWPYDHFNHSKWINETFFFFVDEKDEEMDIGYPTDVRHVSHIGWDSSSSSAPSWVRHFVLENSNVNRCWFSLNLFIIFLTATWIQDEQQRFRVKFIVAVYRQVLFFFSTINYNFFFSEKTI